LVYINTGPRRQRLPRRINIRGDYNRSADLPSDALCASWLEYKSEDITNSIEDPAKRVYLDKFQKTQVSTDAQAKQLFYAMYHRRFGRRHFVGPFILVTLVALAEASLVFEAITGSSSGFIWKPQLSVNAGGVAALAGAYMWVVGDFISRSRRFDFSPADVMWGALRLVISVPLGLFLGSIATNQLANFVAFALGAFPLDTLQVALRQLSYKQLAIELGPTETSDLLRLDGVNKPLAERLANEDINSVVQLAYCDPIQLTMRSGLSFNAVVDLVSQSLAWVYVAEKLPALRPLGLRGAYEIRQLLDDLDSSDNKAKDAANKILPTVASTLGLDVDRASFVLRQVAYDPYTDFIYSTWS